MDSKTFERELSSSEVYDRRLQVETLLDVRDELARKMSEHKFEVKKLQTADSAADSQVRHLRWEIRTRRTYEPQPELPGIDGAGDEPDEDTYPPPPREDPKVNNVSDHALQTLLRQLGVPVELAELQGWDHRQLYESKRWALAPGAWPRPAHFRVLGSSALHQAIARVRPKGSWPSVEQIENWSHDVRFDVQRYCLTEHARNGHIAGHPMPLQLPMPNVLANIETKKPARKPRSKKTGA